MERLTLLLIASLLIMAEFVMSCGKGNLQFVNHAGILPVASTSQLIAAPGAGFQKSASFIIKATAGVPSPGNQSSASFIIRGSTSGAP